MSIDVEVEVQGVEAVVVLGTMCSALRASPGLGLLLGLPFVPVAAKSGATAQSLSSPILLWMASGSVQAKMTRAMWHTPVVVGGNHPTRNEL